MKNEKTMILMAFCLSSAAALIYQVVWSRELGYIFGTSMYAVSTILTTFMAGLALGSYFIGRMVDNSKNPLRLFSYLEIGIGVYGLAVMALFKIIPYFYLFLFNLFSWNQQIFNFSLFMLAFTSLVIPTTLIGGTFPVIAKIFNNDIKNIGKDTGIVYSADTIGACIGVVMGSFFLLPALGLGKTAIIAAIMNIFVGIYVKS